MLKVALINMPFSAVHLPSIALTQLKALLDQRFPERVQCDILYLNHDFARHFELKHYRQVASAVNATVSGLGDWLFRAIAFPELEPANSKDAYVDRYLRHSAVDPASLKRIVEHRPRMAAFMNELIDRHQLDRYDVIGFTSMFIQNLASFAMARMLKERKPDVVTVMGGANCEMSMGRVIAKNVEAIDFVFSGPSLKSFPEFVEHLLSGSRDACHRITGVFSRRKLALQLTESSGAEIGEELDIDTPIPLNYGDYLASVDEHWPAGQVRPSFLFETSRGCWWGERAHCTFCGLNGTTMKYRSMSAERAVDQFEKMFSYAPRISRFESVDNILPREYLTDVLPRLNPPDDVSVFYEVKADLKDHEMEVLAKGGVREIQPGIEALSTSTLKLMKKGTTSFQNIRFLQNCLVHDIKPVWNLLIGFPGEKEEVYAKYEEDLPSLFHLPPPSGVYPVRFDRFSPYFTQAKEYGLNLKPYDFYGMLYPFEAKDLAQLAYFFEDQNYSAEYIQIAAKWIARLQAKIDQWLAGWNVTRGEKPRLEWEWSGDQQVLLDTRHGERIEHHLSPIKQSVLEALDTPNRVSVLAKKLPNWSEAELQTCVDELKSRRLVFQERDLYQSLAVRLKGDRGSI